MEIGGRFAVIEEIGQGGVGLVYKCEDKVLRKVVAVKVLHPLELEGQAARFHRECVALAKLKHKNILQVSDFGQGDDGRLFLVMEYLEGRTLADAIEENQWLNVEAAIPIFIEICNGLEQAHKNGILHRDVKPSNIMLSRDGTKPEFVKIVDFGIAHIETDDHRLTRTGVGLGTPLYMSPEQSRGEAIDARSDIYSLGILMFETLTGRPPFRGENAIDTIIKHREEVAPKLADVNGTEYGDELERIVARCLNKDREDRYANVHSLKADLEKLLRSEREEESHSHPLGLEAKPIRFHISPKVLFVVAALIGISGLVAFFYSWTVEEKTVPEELTSSESWGTMDNTIEPRKMDDGRPLYVVHGDYLDDRVFSSRLIGSKMRQLQFHKDAFDGSGYAALEARIKPRALIFRQCKFKDSAITDLPILKSLDSLEFSESENINDSSFKALEGCPLLQSLELNGNHITDRTIPYVSGLKGLRTLHLHHSPYLHGDNLEQLAALSMLESINLSYTGLTKKNLLKLSRFKKLKSAGLRSLHITDDDLKSIAKLKLESILLDENDISDRGLAELAGMTSLKSVTVTRCPKVTENGISEFMKRRPDCKIAYKDQDFKKHGYEFFKQLKETFN